MPAEYKASHLIFKKNFRSTALKGIGTYIYICVSLLDIEIKRDIFVFLEHFCVWIEVRYQRQNLPYSV